jgi:hypothetical protein
VRTGSESGGHRRDAPSKVADRVRCNRAHWAVA